MSEEKLKAYALELTGDWEATIRFPPDYKIIVPIPYGDMRLLSEAVESGVYLTVPEEN